ncbi:Hvo_1808 family surface protein [Halostella litorea]|uniref:Hvo_1808 family surface protein n=1 Tax=Halostella litorea TaxID=2528831 RepID=UPI0010930223|nr:Hvo_1808 family surface protein [Halostella litorea]
MRVRVLVVACLLVTAGCALPGGRDTPAGHDEDPLGWEDGRWYDDGVDVDASDGLDERELEAVTARAKARVERIRGLEFEGDVSVEVISRAEFRERGGLGRSYSAHDDQVWEAALLVGEDTTAQAAFGEVYGGSVAGYYSGGRIVVVADDPDVAAVSRETLVHELVHALQAQHLRLGGSASSVDGRRAATALVEGDANYVMDRYEERCGSEWDCIERAQRGSSSRSYNRGLFVATFLPYSDGPELVSDLRERGGWDAVDGAYDDMPASTEQVIHPERYPDEKPVDVTVPDRSADGWERFGGTETLGEATLYATFRHNGVIPEDHLTSDARRYNYSHPITDGWAGDTVVPYRSGGEFGYVFESEWDTVADAREFAGAYRDLLGERDATAVGDGVYRVPEDDAFGDAFRVVREGRTVRVVNAPTVDDLPAVHAERAG